MYQRQITVKYDDRINPYTMRIDRQYIFKNTYGKFNFLRTSEVKNMSLSEVIDYMLDVLSYQQFLEYIGKYKRSFLVKKISNKICNIAYEKRNGGNYEIEHTDAFSRAKSKEGPRKKKEINES